VGDNLITAAAEATKAEAPGIALRRSARALRWPTSSGDFFSIGTSICLPSTSRRWLTGQQEFCRQADKS
jgi:hypothetical protein